MRAQDPVCGMWVEPGNSTATSFHAGQPYYFCADGCRRLFDSAPECYLPEPASSAPPGASEGEPSDTGPGDSPTEQPCPRCGRRAVAIAAEKPLIGRLTLDEFEVIVRGEWCWRLGKDACGREHPRELIRGLITFALSPTSPLRADVVGVLLHSEIVRLQTAGLDRLQVERELYSLSKAIWRGLGIARVPVDEATGLMQAIDAELLGTRETRDPSSAKTQRTEPPVGLSHALNRSAPAAPRPSIRPDAYDERLEEPR